MNDNWLSSLIHGFGFMAHKERKIERARQEYLSQRREGFITAITTLHEVLSNLLLECGPIGLPSEFVEDMKFAPLYAIGEVLSAQGTILSEQENVLRVFFINFNPLYNYAQYTQAVINRTGIYEQYWNIAALGENECGSLWQTLFELIYRTRLTDALQSIDDQLSLIAVNFAFLGDSESYIPEQICSRILNYLNKHFNSYQQTPRIHAMMLLQIVLFEKRNLSIEDHYLLQETDIIQHERKFYVFNVYTKSTRTFYGKYAVCALNYTADGQLDYQNDTDVIDIWNNTKCEYEAFYRE